MITAVNKKRTASFDIDCQKGFTPLFPNELPVPGGHSIVGECNKNAIRAQFRIGSGDFHPSNAVWLANEKQPQFSALDYPEANIAWNAHCMSGTKGAELLDGLPAIKDYNYFVFKGIVPDLHPFSPIYHDLSKKMSTGVVEWAKAHDITTFICGGLALEYCYGEGVLDLLKAGFQVIVNFASTKGLTDTEGQIKYLEKLKQAGAFVVFSADEISVV